MDKKYETVTRIMGGNEGKKEIESPEMNVKKELAIMSYLRVEWGLRVNLSE